MLVGGDRNGRRLRNWRPGNSAHPCRYAPLVNLLSFDAYRSRRIDANTNAITLN